MSPKAAWSTAVPRKGSKYATLTDILARLLLQGLCQIRPFPFRAGSPNVGENLLVWREVLHFESGESIYTEHPIAIPDQGTCRARSSKTWAAAITYARKYCLQGLYGLYADDGLDPDEISYGDAGTSQSKPSRSSTPKDSPEPPTEKAATAVAQAFSGEVVVDDASVTVERTRTAGSELTRRRPRPSEIIKDKDHGKEWTSRSS